VVDPLQYWVRPVLVLINELTSQGAVVSERFTTVPDLLVTVNLDRHFVTPAVQDTVMVWPTSRYWNIPVSPM
jgi:hypothetical protein